MASQDPPITVIIYWEIHTSANVLKDGVLFIQSSQAVEVGGKERILEAPSSAKLLDFKGKRVSPA